MKEVLACARRSRRKSAPALGTLWLTGLELARTLIQRSRVNDDDAELLPLPLGLEQDALDDARPRVGKNHIAVVDLFDRVLLDHARGEEDAVADERVDLRDEEGFGL